jgi:hypothetical protein
MESISSNYLVSNEPCGVRIDLLDELKFFAKKKNKSMSVQIVITEPKCESQGSDTNKSLLKLNDFERNNENTITDFRYDCQSYDKNLMRRLLCSTDEQSARAVLTQMWHEMKFCDLIFIVSGKQYLTHRLILGFYSAKYKFVFLDYQCAIVTVLLFKPIKKLILYFVGHISN